MLCVQRIPYNSSAETITYTEIKSGINVELTLTAGLCSAVSDASWSYSAQVDRKFVNFLLEDFQVKFVEQRALSNAQGGITTASFCYE